MKARRDRELQELMAEEPSFDEVLLPSLLPGGVGGGGGPFGLRGGPWVHAAVWVHAAARSPPCLNWS